MSRNVLALGMSALAVGALVAATTAQAAANSVTVPKAGPKTVTTSWSGTVPMGVSTTFSDCKGNADWTYDSHPFQVTVQSGAYKVVKAKLAYVVSSSPLLNGDFIQLIDPAGNSVGVDQQKKTMEVDVDNPSPGTWTALVCSFIPDSASSHAYETTVTITTTCLGKATHCPAAPKRRK